MATEDSKQTKSNQSGDRANRAADAISAKFSGPLAPLEKALDGVLGEKAPYKIPAKARETLVKISPWISLVSGILGLLAALALWRAAHLVNQVSDSLRQLSAVYGTTTQQVDKLGLAFWLALIALVAFSLLALLAFPGLKNRKKTGWNLMFFSTLANLVYAVITLFYDGAGQGSFFGTAIGSVIGLYLLFQVRSYYKS